MCKEKNPIRTCASQSLKFFRCFRSLGNFARIFSQGNFFPKNIIQVFFCFFDHLCRLLKRNAFRCYFSSHLRNILREEFLDSLNKASGKSSNFLSNSLISFSSAVIAFTWLFRRSAKRVCEDHKEERFITKKILSCL